MIALQQSLMLPVRVNVFGKSPRSFTDGLIKIRFQVFVWEYGGITDSRKGLFRLSSFLEEVHDLLKLILGAVRSFGFFLIIRLEENGIITSHTVRTSRGIFNCR